MRFRAAVYGKRDGLTNGCRVLLLRLSDDMNANAIVSIPRSKLAHDLDVAPARITEWIQQAKDLGFLDTVRRGRPGVTATYQGLNPGPLGTPGRTSERYARADQAGVRHGVPQDRPAWYATAITQEGEPNATSAPCPAHATGADEEASGCDVCGDYGCSACIPDETEAC
jgi:hypothetical protein